VTEVFSYLAFHIYQFNKITDSVKKAFFLNHWRQGWIFLKKSNKSLKKNPDSMNWLH
jgi:hypothetical protein